MPRIVKTRPIDPAGIFAEKIYTDAELKKFHQDIQKYYTLKEVIRPSLGLWGPETETIRLFNFDTFGVAYGALITRPGAFGRTHYLVGKDGSERYAQMWKLWGQYEDWRRRQDYIENKRNEELEVLAQSG